MSRKRLILVLASSVTLDIVLGIAFASAQHVSVWNGLYFATTTGSTVGYGDITPHGWGPHVIAVAMMVTIIPLIASLWALFTTALTTAHVDRRHRAMIDQMHEHHEALLKHVTAETAGCGPAVYPLPWSHGGCGGNQAGDSGSGGGGGGALADNLGGVPGGPEHPSDVPGAPDEADR